jgi:hypothetical protein
MNNAKLLDAIDKAETYATQNFKDECRATCWMTRQNIEMVKADPDKHATKFIEMYSNIHNKTK